MLYFVIARSLLLWLSRRQARVRLLLPVCLFLKAVLAQRLALRDAAMLQLSTVAVFFIIIVMACEVAETSGSGGSGKWMMSLKDKFFPLKISSFFIKSFRRRSGSMHIDDATADSLSSSSTGDKSAPGIGRIVGASVPPVVLAILGSLPSVSHAHHMNKQPIVVNSPFFQGWLVRATDHSNRRSFIFIVGSLSTRGSHVYDQHYVFCGVGGGTGERSDSYEVFPDPSAVLVAGSPAGSSELDVSWTAKGMGSFRYSNAECSAHFNFSESVSVEFNCTDRRPWNSERLDGGPEGWLGRAPAQLLPCHYFVHSTGSTCVYTIRSGDAPEMKGCGLAHIEGNYGKFFPDGWVWTQASGASNEAALSLVGGLFDISVVKSMNFIIYLRSSGCVFIFRTTDFNSITYDIDGVVGSLNVTATNSNHRLELSVQSRALFNSDIGSVDRDFGGAIYIPTSEGFKNAPGCKETYTAMAIAKCYKVGDGSLAASEVFDMTALEFGGSFLGTRRASGKGSGEG